MISVEEALSRLLAPLEKLPPEQISIADGVGRVLAEDVASRRTQPPFAVSAMDGYAVRADDVQSDLGLLDIGEREVTVEESNEGADRAAAVLVFGFTQDGFFAGRRLVFEPRMTSGIYIAA